MATQSLEKKREVLVVRRNSGVALIIFDSASKFNSLGTRTIEELEQLLETVEKDQSIKALVGISGKADSFIIGADLYEIRKAESQEELLRLSVRGQALLNKVACFSKPLLMAVNGPCLGGGLEMALAAHYILASDHEITQLALPETRLGLVPGLGGTQRLPRKIGLKAALDMILQAEPLGARQAKAIGLVDSLVPQDRLIEEAEKKALELIDSQEWKAIIAKNQEMLREESAASPDKTGTGSKATKFCLTELTAEKAEKLLAISERAVKIRTKGNYPAQLEAIRVLREGLQKGFLAGLEAEAQAFAELAAGEVSANLISLFFASDLAKSSARSLVKKFAKSPIQSLGVVGAGNMGKSLAQIAALHNIKVKLKTGAEKIAPVKEEMQQFAQRSFAGVKFENEETKNLALERLVANVEVLEDINELSSCDLIIESVVEEISAKLPIIEKLSEQGGEHTVIASNTSALSISELAKSASNAENFLGVHFFHPVDKMPLVELIQSPHTSKAALAKACDLVLKMDKIPLLVKDKPGFLINRLLTVYLFELARLAEEKTPINWIEDCMLEFGMPMGPLQLMDEIGIDVAFTVARNLEAGLGARMQSPEIFKRVCASGITGKRANVGFYLWENCEKRLQINPDMLEKTQALVSAEKCPPAEANKIVDRMIFAMLDEACRCLEEKVVAKAREIDFALILGVGFPAFRGGLLKYADKRGLANILPVLEQIYVDSEKRGSAGHRQVSDLLASYANERRGFYSLAGKEEA